LIRAGRPHVAKHGLDSWKSDEVRKTDVTIARTT
jgi:hypothetical protein